MTSKSLHIISKKVTSSTDWFTSPGEWAMWVNHDEAGLGDTSNIPSAGDIDADNDGELNPRYRAVCDLSHGLSYHLGKQLPQTAVYRLKGIKVAIRPQDDDVDNADGSILFGGDLKWMMPNKHNIDAIQAARKVEQLSESTQVDTDSDVFGLGGADYNGFRFGWRTEIDGFHLTRESFSNTGIAVEGGDPSWTLWSDDGALGILDNYNDYKGLVPSAGQDRALWATRVGRPTTMKWAVAWNSDATGGALSQPDFEWRAPAGNHIDVLGGMVLLDVLFSSTDPPGSVDDDYHVFVQFEVEGWEAF